MGHSPATLRAAAVVQAVESEPRLSSLPGAGLVRPAMRREAKTSTSRSITPFRDSSCTVGRCRSIYSESGTPLRRDSTPTL